MLSKSSELESDVIYGQLPEILKFDHFACTKLKAKPEAKKKAEEEAKLKAELKKKAELEAKLKAEAEH